MAWPTDSLPVTIEMDADSWVDITDRTRVAEQITIRRGFPEAGNTAEPSSISLTLDNRDGDLTPRNPSGTYYGLFGRNTPIRVTIGSDLAGQPYLSIPLTDVSIVNTGDACMESTNHASFAVTDLDLRWDGALDGWESGAVLATKWNTTGNQRSWAFTVNTSGELELEWSPDGTSGAALTATSSVVAGVENGERKALRVTLDVDNGAGGRTATFYTADAIDGTWVQLGSAVTFAATTSVFSSTASIVVGQDSDFSELQQSGRIYAFQIMASIGGSAVANPNFTAQSAGTDSFVDAAGRTWTHNAFAHSSIVDPGIRGYGEVSEWPTRWDVSGADVAVSAVAQGVLRRLGQGDRPTRSPYTSFVQNTYNSSTVPPAGYWSMEDAGGTSFASGVSGGSPTTYSGTTPEFYATGAILGSDSVALLGATTALAGDLSAAASSSFNVSMLLDVPASPGWADGTVILRVQMDPTSSMGFWEIRYKTGGDLQLATLDHDGVDLSTSGTLTFGIDGESVLLELYTSYSTPTSTWTVYVLRVDANGATDLSSSLSSFATGPLGYPVRVHVAPNGGLTSAGVGQVLVPAAASLLLSQFDGFPSPPVFYEGEVAGWRAARLIREVGVEPTIKGVDPSFYEQAWVTFNQDDGTQTMGAQAVPVNFADAFAETVPAEMALVYEPRDSLGLVWRTRSSLYNQAAALTLNYEAAGEVAPDLQPTDDDRYVVNDVEVKRKNGSSARATDSTSRVGTQSPPDGVGRYETSVEINIDSDDALADHANWRLHVGTWDELRYPKVRIDMRALAAAGKTTLVEQAAQLDVGDRLVLQNLPVWVSPDDADLLCVGFTETIGAFDWVIEVNCVPYGPYDVGTYGTTSTATKRYDTLHSTTAEALDTTETGVDVTNGGAQWGTQTPYDIVIGGERMTVTAVSGTGASQTLTVTRSVNGITKSHDSGAQVRIVPESRAFRAL